MATEKLIRDKLEERVLAGNVRKETDSHRLLALLNARLDQDLAELRAAAQPNAADFADICELLLALAAHLGISPDQIEAARLARREERGGFDSGLVWTPPDPVFSVAHEIPGRLRFAAPALKHNAPLMRALATRVAGLAGVKSADTNPITGCLVVWHDAAPGTRREIMRTLETLSLAPVAGEVARPVIHPPSDARLAARIAETVGQGFAAAMETAVERAAEEAVEAAVAALL